jgi:hypothetical protein
MVVATVRFLLRFLVAKPHASARESKGFMDWQAVFIKDWICEGIHHRHIWRKDGGFIEIVAKGGAVGFQKPHLYYQCAPAYYPIRCPDL